MMPTPHSIPMLERFGDQFLNPVTLVDLEVEDQPLVFVNRQFEQLTGYSREEILGRNCRFLQGPDTDPLDVKKIRESISERLAVFVDILNYRKNQQPFHNRLVLLPFEYDYHEYYLGMQIDSSDLVSGFESESRKFDDFKKSEMIRDKINNPLMVIRHMAGKADESVLGQQALAGAFHSIVTTVKKIGFLDLG